jgi:tetratricopeptide (TPR) repeat protein
LLETIRQYAIEKLQEHGEEEVIRDRHLSYCLKLAEETMDFDGSHVDAWLRRINPDYDNMRAALAWACTRDDHGEQALHLAAGLRVFWHFRPRYSEALTWFDKALSLGAAASPSARARALLAQASIYVFQGNLPRALSIVQTSLNLFRTTDDQPGTAWCLEVMAHIASNLNLPTARELAEEALTLFRELRSSLSRY